MQDSKVQEEEGLEAKTTIRLAMLRLGSTTSTNAGNGNDHEGPVLSSDPCSVRRSMKRSSPSPSSLQQLTFDNEEPRNKKILLDPSSLSLTDYAAAARNLADNSTVTTPTQQQQPPQFQFSALARSVSGPLQFHFFTPASTTQGQGTNLRRCQSGPVASPEINDDLNYFRDPVAPPSIPASLVRSESFPNPQQQEKNNHPAETEKTPPPEAPAALPSCERLPSFSGSTNTPLTSPDATLPLHRPSLPRPAPPSIPSTTQTTEKTGMTAMAEPKDPSRSTESGQTVVCSTPESPAEKRLNRMKKRIKDMHKWWKKVLQEDEAEISTEDKADQDEIFTKDKEDEAEISTEDKSDEPEISTDDKADEAEISTEDKAISTNVQREVAVIPRSEREGGVIVERDGTGYCIHYWCNCGSHYQIHISLSDPMTVCLYGNTERMC